MGAACSSSGSDSSPLEFDDTRESYLLRLAACYQDGGVDAEVIDGGVRADRSGVLGLEEALALQESCEQQLEDEGVVVLDPWPDGKPYEAYVAERDCAVRRGVALPDLVSEATYLAQPDRMIPPAQSAFDLLDFDRYREAVADCFPDFVAVDLEE